MNTDLHKRLEEAAGKYIKIITPDDIPYYHKDVKQGFLAGAEYSYREAIAQAKKWLGENMYKYYSMLSGELYFDGDEMLFDFETDMNELWDEKK